MIIKLLALPQPIRFIPALGVSWLVAAISVEKEDRLE